MKNLKYLIIIIIFIFIHSFSFWFTSLWWDNLGSSFDLLKNIVEDAYLVLWPLMFLAWKFLSNTFVYWSSFGIDVILWKLWHMIRVFANYLIWFIFIISIFVYFFKSDSSLSWKKILPRIVIAWIFVNISWFLIATLIDISSILILAAWSIWNVFSDSKLAKNFDNTSMMVPLTINTDSTGNFISIVWKDWKEYNACIRNKDNKLVKAPCFSFKNWQFVILNKNWSTDLTKSIWVSSKNISWDGLGMLISLFRYINWSFLSSNVNNTVSWYFTEIINFFLLFILIIPFIILSIILVVRVVLLWVIIPLSPLIFWAYILWIFNSEIKNKFIDIITLIFQPAYIVFMLSIWFIFIQAIQSLAPVTEDKNKLETLWLYNWWTKDKNIKDKSWKNVEKTVQTVNIWWKNDPLIVIQAEYDKKQGKTDSNTDYKNILYYFWWIIANLLSAFVLWTLVFIAFRSNKITRKISDPVETYAKKWLEALPIFPAWHSVLSLEQTWSDVMSWIPKQLSQQQTRELTNKFKKNW